MTTELPGFFLADAGTPFGENLANDEDINQIETGQNQSGKNRGGKKIAHRCFLETGQSTVNHQHDTGGDENTEGPTGADQAG